MRAGAMLRGTSLDPPHRWLPPARCREPLLGGVRQRRALPEPGARQRIPTTQVSLLSPQLVHCDWLTNCVCFDETNKPSLMLSVSLFIDPEDQTAQADAKDNKSVSPSSDPDSAAGMDVDQDYTLICSPPTQAEVW